MGLIEDGYFEGKNKSQTKFTENRAGTVDSVGVHGPPMPVHGVGSETQASERADSRSQDSMSGIDALPAHEAPVHFLSDASAAHRRSHTGRSSRVWDCTIKPILYDQSRIVLFPETKAQHHQRPKRIIPEATPLS